MKENPEHDPNVIVVKLDDDNGDVQFSIQAERKKMRNVGHSLKLGLGQG
jgi:hypothetical protein